MTYSNSSARRYAETTESARRFVRLATSSQSAARSPMLTARLRQYALVEANALAGLTEVALYGARSPGQRTSGVNLINHDHATIQQYFTTLLLRVCGLLDSFVGALEQQESSATVPVLMALDILLTELHEAALALTLLEAPPHELSAAVPLNTYLEANGVPAATLCVSSEVPVPTSAMTLALLKLLSRSAIRRMPVMAHSVDSRVSLSVFAPLPDEAEFVGQGRLAIGKQLAAHLGATLTCDGTRWTTTLTPRSASRGQSASA
ncbi:MAG: hypothetical protein Q8Q09_18755 [Deltaproteobacteria bacterium]|nr:hypothetical protein [Deltaproteobacteria bacterium]